MQRRKVALVTGVTGQDGAYLSAFLISQGYTVHGLKRRTSSYNSGRIESLLEDPLKPDRSFVLHYGDMTDAASLIRIVQSVEPDEIYNLAAQSHVGISFETPEYTANADALGVLRLLEAIRILRLERKTRFYQASSSELFGHAEVSPQCEETPFAPRSPYATAKLYAHWIVRNYREAYGLHASNGILFNHESPTRGDSFVTRKITRAAAAIRMGLQQRLYLGNLNARRDWGDARDYVRGMWLMLQQDEPGDYVLATGESATVRQFAAEAFAQAGIDLEWAGEGLDERGLCARTGQTLIAVDPRRFRPSEADNHNGDASKARAKLGWAPTRDWRSLCAEMVRADMAAASQARAQRRDLNAVE